MSRYSDNLLRILSQGNLEPVIALEIEGIDFLVTSDLIRRRFLYGDDVEYGDPAEYGGLVAINGQKQLISLKNTTTTISQNLEPDKAKGGSVSSVKVSLVDIDGEATKIASGFYNTELLFKRVKVWVGFSIDSSFNDDFVLMFRGQIDDITAGQGFVDLKLSSPDQKRRQTLAPQGDTELNGAITDLTTVIVLDSAENFVIAPDTPKYSGQDPSLKTYIRIEDEIIQYTSIAGTTLGGVVRGAQNTTAVSHGDAEQVISFYEISGNAMEMALKMMLSSDPIDNYISFQSVASVNVYAGGYEANTFFVADTDLVRNNNLRSGDYIQSTGFINGANNITAAITALNEVLEVTVINGGTLIKVDATLVDEPIATGSISILSQWNTWGQLGLGLIPDEVDIEHHLFLQDTFLLTSAMKFYLIEEISEGKAFIEGELYRPLACYSLPSDSGGLARLSVGLHNPPLPLEQIQTIDIESVRNPDMIKVSRSVNKYHYNAILHKFEDAPLDEVLRRKIYTVPGTVTINSGQKTLIIESRGLKNSLTGSTLATQAGTKLLDRYRGAAEYIKGLNVSFATGSLVNIGDIVIFDPTGLNVINRTTSARDKEPLLMEVLNKKTDIKTGLITLDLIDTSFDITSRYSLIGPASKIQTVLSGTQIVVEALRSYSVFAGAEGDKWSAFENYGIQIRNEDFSLVHLTTVTNVTGNTLTLAVAPSFTAAAGMIIEPSNYDFAGTSANYKLVYGSLSDDVNDFGDGGKYYSLI